RRARQRRRADPGRRHRHVSRRHRRDLVQRLWLSAYSRRPDVPWPHCGAPLQGILMQLQSYAKGQWVNGSGEGTALRDATTGAVIAHASAQGLDYAGMLDYARRVGGPALRALTFHERASLIKALAKHLTDRKEEFYSLSYATGATRTDSWIDIDGG